MRSSSKLITVSPEIMWGTLVIAGTRVPVKALFDYLQHGHSVDDFLDDFPTVQRDQAIALIAEAGSQILSGSTEHADTAR